jgi:hypothetical protein
MATKKKTETKPVIITTSHRGVFFGDLEKGTEESRTVTLTGARNAIYWATTKGFIELAQTGPNSKSKVGAVAPRIVLHDVTSVTECTEAAAAAWRSFP